MSWKGYGCRDSVQAPLTLITAFGRLASSSTFGRSAQGCAGAGGTRGCMMPRWSMMNRVSGWRSMIGHRRIVRVNRLNDGEPVGMGPLHLDRIAGVIAVRGKGGDEDRAVDADLVHRPHHLVTRDVIGPVRHTVPGSLRSVRVINMDLGIDDSHRGSSSVRRKFGYHKVRVEASCVADASRP